uniref:Reverse transcriptase RNase H-like domain-containing protein n=1 Tax=Lactuca sativa TaxID=4236 RepID=A0A9R1XID2_LACSA|nr:hypothetical protein LSAT_V11C400185560 [Lactuca sativa]
MWTEKTDAALQQPKDAQHQLPTLTCPLPGETLQMYLVASEEAISSMLVVEREGKQVPIHFVSGALQGLEVNYLALEKLILALVYAVRRLWMYCQAHKVDVLTSYPIKQVMLSIKAQALANFLAEILYTIKGVPTTISVDLLEPEAGKELWKLYTDDTTSKEDITYTLRFDFQVSNNEAGYEAHIGGLRLAKEVGSKKLVALSDSLLVTIQINRTYEVKDPGMQKYLDAVCSLASTFKNFSIKKIS